MANKDFQNGFAYGLAALGAVGGPSGTGDYEELTNKPFYQTEETAITVIEETTLLTAIHFPSGYGGHIEYVPEISLDNQYLVTMTTDNQEIEMSTYITTEFQYAPGFTTIIGGVEGEEVFALVVGCEFNEDTREMMHSDTYSYVAAPSIPFKLYEISVREEEVTKVIGHSDRYLPTLQADWDEANKEATSYIRNKPFYDETEERNEEWPESRVVEIDAISADDGMYFEVVDTFDIPVDDFYAVNIEFDSEGEHYSSYYNMYVKREMLGDDIYANMALATVTNGIFQFNLADKLDFPNQSEDDTKATIVITEITQDVENLKITFAPLTNFDFSDVDPDAEKMPAIGLKKGWEYNISVVSDGETVWSQDFIPTSLSEAYPGSESGYQDEIVGLIPAYVDQETGFAIFDACNYETTSTPFSYNPGTCFLSFDSSIAEGDIVITGHNAIHQIIHNIKKIDKKFLPDDVGGKIEPATENSLGGIKASVSWVDDDHRLPIFVDENGSAYADGSNATVQSATPDQAGVVKVGGVSYVDESQYIPTTIDYNGKLFAGRKAQGIYLGEDGITTASQVYDFVVQALTEMSF